ncbi:hypothetical protein NEOLEDRAFT_204769 [Neolentinus lepideus HHB14362 ss-1]|uniref:Uncharacterized protein n=1 Tax=Neolentinus lepideus HHB14362 ss-1 TaxID=1314782 RepID=A0A165TJ14_9AGAM|nr:hypothetical protein NEOLEDRAFT_204769 [Neolentinus lepideus HHB14362 ss-1]
MKEHYETSSPGDQSRRQVFREFIYSIQDSQTISVNARKKAFEEDQESQEREFQQDEVVKAVFEEKMKSFSSMVMQELKTQQMRSDCFLECRRPIIQQEQQYRKVSCDKLKEDLEEQFNTILRPWVESFHVQFEALQKERDQRVQKLIGDYQLHEKSSAVSEDTGSVTMPLQGPEASLPSSPVQTSCIIPIPLEDYQPEIIRVPLSPDDVSDEAPRTPSTTSYHTPDVPSGHNSLVEEHPVDSESTSNTRNDVLVFVEKQFSQNQAQRQASFLQEENERQWRWSCKQGELDASEETRRQTFQKINEGLEAAFQQEMLGYDERFEAVQRTRAATEAVCIQLFDEAITEWASTFDASDSSIDAVYLTIADAQDALVETAQAIINRVIERQEEWLKHKRLTEMVAFSNKEREYVGRLGLPGPIPVPCRPPSPLYEKATRAPRYALHRQFTPISVSQPPVVIPQSLDWCECMSPVAGIGIQNLAAETHINRPLPTPYDNITDRKNKIDHGRRWERMFQESQDEMEHAFQEGMKRRQQEFILNEMIRQQRFTIEQAARCDEWELHRAACAGEFTASQRDRVKKFHRSQRERAEAFQEAQRTRGKSFLSFLEERRWKARANQSNREQGWISKEKERRKQFFHWEGSLIVRLDMVEEYKGLFREDERKRSRQFEDLIERFMILVEMPDGTTIERK